MEPKDQEQDPEDDTIPVTDSEEEREAADKYVYSSLDHHKPQKRNQLRVRVPNCSERSTSTGSQEMETTDGDDAPMYHSVGHHISSHMCVSMTSTYNVVAACFSSW